jgi:hypothetical protein
VAHTGGGALGADGQPGRMERNDRRPLPLAAHAAIEPLAALLFIAGPWIFGFSDVDDAKVVSIVLGVLVLLTGLSTRWRMGLVKLLSLGAHRAMDVVVAVVAIVSPFVLGFSDIGSATRFLVIMGVLELGAVALTRWDPRDDFAVEPAGRRGTASPAR